MSKTLFVAAAALVLALPSAAQDKNNPLPEKSATAAADAGATHSATSTSDRQAAKKLAATGAATVALGASRGDTRDWAAIDANKDNLISPDEMQKYLEQSCAARKK